jgi:tetratricopeptide (TPR) repeat protein
MEKAFKLPEFGLTLARIKYEQANFYDALTTIMTTEQEFGPSVDLYNLRGVCQRKLGDFPAAISAYEDALKVSPMDAKVYYNMAACAISAKTYDEAISYLETCKQINPNFPKIQEKLEEVRAKAANQSTDDVV